MGALKIHTNKKQDKKEIKKEQLKNGEQMSADIYFDLFVRFDSKSNKKKIKNLKIYVI